MVSAHEAAVADALGYLEAEAAFVRRGKDGLVRLPAEGFVGAAFVHTTSRLGDPQLHTHLVTPNLAKGLDGAWSALDARALYRHARTAGFLYQASLRAGLTEALGLSWRPVERGMAEPSGIPKEVLSHFSRRRAEIEEALRLAGQNSAAAANIAAHRTRRPKDHDISPEALRTSWQVRAESIGFGPEHLAGLVQEPRIPEAFDLTEQAARLLGPEGLTERTSTFGRQDVLRSLASAAREGARVDELQAIAGELLTDPRAVPLRPVRGRNMESGPWLLRGQDTSGRITHVGLRPAAALTEVTVETPEASGMAVELASDHPGVSQPLSSHPATEQGGLRKLTVEFSGELPRNAWVLLKRDRTWVDRRFLNWGYRTGADEDIEEVVERQAELEALVSLGEGPNIEFKVELPPRQAGSEALNFLRTVAAFANGQGGRILFGVTDDGDVLGLLRSEAESRTRDRITELVRATVTPLPNYSLDSITSRAGRKESCSVCRCNLDPNHPTESNRAIPPTTYVEVPRPSRLHPKRFDISLGPDPRQHKRPGCHGRSLNSTICPGSVAHRSSLSPVSMPFAGGTTLRPGTRSRGQQLLNPLRSDSDTRPQLIGQAQGAVEHVQRQVGGTDRRCRLP